MFDAERRIVLEPSNIDRVADQHAQHFQDRQCGSRSGRIGLQDSDDPFARQPLNSAMAVLRP